MLYFIWPGSFPQGTRTISNETVVLNLQRLAVSLLLCPLAFKHLAYLHWADYPFPPLRCMSRICQFFMVGRHLVPSSWVKRFVKGIWILAFVMPYYALFLLEGDQALRLLW